MIKKVIIGLFLFLFMGIGASEAAIKLKILAVNPSAAEEKTTPVRFDLPKGISPENVLDAGGLELRYDFDRGNYYVYKEIVLKPAEKLRFEIELEDIWAIPAKGMEFLRRHTRMLLDEVKLSQHIKVAEVLAKEIEKQLDKIRQQQSDISLSTKKRIDLYYEHQRILTEIKVDIGMLENLVVDSGGVIEQKVGTPSVKAVSAGEKEAEAEPIKLNIKISNPSAEFSQTMPLTYYLPKEVSPKYILAKGGLEIAYDIDQGSFYAYKDGVELAPDETKVFTIELKDIWNISQVKINTFKTHTNNLILLLKGTEFFPAAELLANKIITNLEKIAKSQMAKLSAEEHIGRYRHNLEILQKAAGNIAELEKMVVESGGTPSITVAGVKKGKGVKGFKGIEFIAKSIFKGKAPTPATTWKIIFIIIGFVAGVSALFFGLWYKQVKKTENRKR